MVKSTFTFTYSQLPLPVMLGRKNRYDITPAVRGDRGRRQVIVGGKGNIPLKIKSVIFLIQIRINSLKYP